MTQTFTNPNRALLIKIIKFFFFILAFLNMGFLIIQIFMTVFRLWSPTSLYPNLVFTLILLIVSILGAFLSSTRKQSVIFLAINSLLQPLTSLAIWIFFDGGNFVNSFRYLIGEPLRFSIYNMPLTVAFGIGGNVDVHLRFYELISTLRFFALLASFALLVFAILSKETTFQTKPSVVATSTEAQVKSNSIQGQNTNIDRQVEQLEKFGQLYKEGLLSKEEFEKKKREILG